MTSNEREILKRIHEYANLVMPDINPRKTPVSYQLSQLKPIMQTIADEEKISLEDMFIRYMDLASTLSVENEMKFQDEMKLISEEPRR